MQDLQEVLNELDTAFVDWRYLHEDKTKARRITFQPTIFSLHPGQHRYGTAASFAEARAGFEADWESLLPEIPEGAFEEWRHQRDFTAKKYAAWARGEKLPSQYRRE